MGKATAAILRCARRDFDEGQQHPQAVVRGSTRTLWSLRMEARLGREDLRAINDHLQAILDILRQPRPTRGRRTLTALSWVLAPLQDLASRR